MNSQSAADHEQFISVVDLKNHKMAATKSMKGGDESKSSSVVTPNLNQKKSPKTGGIRLTQTSLVLSKGMSQPKSSKMNATSMNAFQDKVLSLMQQVSH